MSDKCCADCFWCGEKVGDYRSVDHRCNKTRKINPIDYCCSNFLDQNNSNAKACWECEYFGTHNYGSIFERKNYCERKSKVVDPDGLACSSFIES